MSSRLERTPEGRDTIQESSRAATIHDRLHLSKDASDIGSCRIGVKQDAEAYCVACHSRVTVGASGEEYGHAGKCPFRPDSYAYSSFYIPADRRNRCCIVCGRAKGDHHPDCRKEGEVCPTCGKDGYSKFKYVKRHHIDVHGEKLHRYQDCAYCDSFFTPKKSRDKYCTEECAHNSLRRREQRDCEICGDSFECKPSQDTRTCGRRCGDILNGVERREGEMDECYICGTQYYEHPSVDKRCCSTACKGVYQWIIPYGGQFHE